MSGKLSIGIMGTGNIARQFASGVNSSARCTLAAVGSRSAETATKFAADFSVPVSHASYDALLQDKSVDAIYISLPNTLHHEWTIKALHHGKHVLCEKPLACSLREAIEMFDAAQSANRVLIEAFMYRAHPQTQAILDTIERGEIGSVKLVRSSFCYRVRQWAGNVRFDKSLAGGSLMDVGCYCIDFSNLIAGGEPTDVHAVARIHETGVDEQTSVVMKYASGITAEFTCGMMVQQDNTAAICGDEGYITTGWPWKPGQGNSKFDICHSIPPRQDATQKAALSPRRTIEVPVSHPLYAIEADAFATAVFGEAQAFVTPAQSLASACVMEKLRRMIAV